MARHEVLRLIDAGATYDEIGVRLSIPPGLAYMIATGKPSGRSEVPVYEPTHRDEVQRWMRARAGGDAQMRAAAQSHWPAAPQLGDTTETSDVITVIRRDHNHFHKLASVLKTTPSTAQGATSKQVERRAAAVQAIRQSLPRHEDAESRVLWPFVRHLWSEGDAFADRARSQDAAATATLARLSEAEPGSTKFDDLVERLQRDLRVHVAFEDRVLLALQTSTAASDRDRLGQELAHLEERPPDAA